MSFLKIAATFTFALASLSVSPALASANGTHVYPASEPGYMPDSLVRSADGKIWFSAAKLRPCPKNVTCQSEVLGTLHPNGVAEIKLGDVTTSGAFGVTPGPQNTLWITDQDKAAYVFDLMGRPVAKVNLRDKNGDGALSPPFIGPDGRMWFAQGSFGTGADSVVEVDAAYHYHTLAKCASCFFAGGLVAADGNAWLTDPYLGGFYRITPQGHLNRFDYGHFTLQAMIAGPNGALWGTTNNSAIAEYDLTGRLIASFSPKIAVQSGLQAVGNQLVWAYFGPSRGGNELSIVHMTTTGATTVSRYHNVGSCTAQNHQWFSKGPVLGGDGALYVAIGCAPQYEPYTIAGQAALVRIAP